MPLTYLTDNRFSLIFCPLIIIIIIYDEVDIVLQIYVYV